MSESAKPASRAGSRRFWIAVAVALAAIVAAANIHLVYVSLASQPACVPHLEAPDGSGTSYRAAKSVC